MARLATAKHDPKVTRLKTLREKKARMHAVRMKLRETGLLVSVDGEKNARVSKMIVFRAVENSAEGGEEIMFRSVNPLAAKGLANRLAYTKR